MEPFSMLLAICEGNSPVTSEFPTQRPVTRSFDVFFDVRLNKRIHVCKSFVYANFNYCPVVWVFSGKKQPGKTGKTPRKSTFDNILR